MTKRKTFYSFHFDNDVMRVQQVRNMGALDGNTPVSPNDWETVKKGGYVEIKKWIHKNMDGKTCVVVLIGEETASRPWVKYEISKAWEDGRAVLGIHIHNLTCPNNGKGKMGANPFNGTIFKDSQGNVKTIPCKNPLASDVYNDIKNNIEAWIEDAIAVAA